MDSIDSKKVPTPKTTSWSNPCTGTMCWDSLDSTILALTLIWAGILFWLGGWDFILPVAIMAIGVFILYQVYDHKRV
jgi:hypothetical protein